jgi:hypothetical protein
LDDDLNTPTALNALAALAEALDQGAAAGRDIQQAQEDLRRMAAVFGLRLQDGAPEPRVRAGWAAHLAGFQDEAAPSRFPD